MEFFARTKATKLMAFTRRCIQHYLESNNDVMMTTIMLMSRFNGVSNLLAVESRHVIPVSHVVDRNSSIIHANLLRQKKQKLCTLWGVMANFQCSPEYIPVPLSTVSAFPGMRMAVRSHVHSRAV